MGWSSLFLLLCLSLGFYIRSTHQLQSSQTQALLQLSKHLEYPKQLEIWYNSSTDVCYFSSEQVNITCQNNFVTELRILGDKKQNKVTKFYGFSIPNKTLSKIFSMDSFVATLARLTTLRVLVLESLGIWGPVPAKIYRLTSLEYLDLSGNYLSGYIPPQISRLVKIQTLVLDGNFLNGTFPDWFDSLPNLTYLSIRDNHLSGLIPSSTHRSILVHLQHLDLSINSLKGPPPTAIFSLPNISYLNLASNLFTGSLPIHLTCGNQLQFVDISKNKIKGLLPSCLSNASDNRVVKYGGNCLLTGVGNQHPGSYCEVHVKRKESKGKDMGILVGVIGGIFAVVLVLAFGFLLVCRRYFYRGTSEQHLLTKTMHHNLVAGFSSDILTNARYISQAAKFGSEGMPVCRLFCLEELMEATNNFDKSTIMGEGSYGKLHKGTLDNGAHVAIRCISISMKYTIRNLKLRLGLLAKLRHPHLVCLLGFCINSRGRDESKANELYFIYEYVPNGNYRAHLSGNSPEKTLNWEDRLSALIGVAKAVHFLHTEIIPGFFNNRLKANSILLNEHRMAKLSDYGLSIVIAEEDYSEVKEEGLKSWQMKSLEDDVYSFGFILLESLVGPTLSARREALLDNEMMSTRNDPAWKYSKRHNDNKFKFNCNFCNKVVNGGVYRVKQHLVDGYTAVTTCPTCPEVVKEEIRGFMSKNKEVASVISPLAYFDEMGNDEEDIDVFDDIQSKPLPKRSALTQDSSARGSNSSQPKPLPKKPKNTGSLDVYFTPDPEIEVEKRKGKSKQGKVDDNTPYKNELKDRAYRSIARWMYDSGIPLNAINYESFESMLEAIGQYGPGLKPPSYYQVRIPLLKERWKLVNKQMKDHKKEWEEGMQSYMR